MADRFDRKAEGKAIGLDLVVIAVNDVSEAIQSIWFHYDGAVACAPLFSVPQTLHLIIASASPEVPSKRLPQSVQNTRDPIAAIDVVPAVVVLGEFQLLSLASSRK